MRVCFAGDLTDIIRVSRIVGCPVFLLDHGIAALLPFFGKCHTLLGPKGAKKEKKTYYKTYVIIGTGLCTHAYISLYYMPKFNWLWCL